MNLVVTAVREATDGCEPPMASAAEPPPPADPTAAAATPAAAVADPRPSLKKRTWDKIACHVAKVDELLEDNEDDFHVEFANDAIRVFQGLMSGRCISGPLISNLNNLCYTHAEDEEVGTQALLLLGRALRKAAESRNEEITVADGLIPGKYGLPALLPPKPPLPRTDSESPERQSASPHLSPIKREFDDEREIKTEEPDDEENNLCFTSGPYIGNNASYVDLSCIPPYRGPVKQVDHISDLKMTDRRIPNDKARPINAPFKPFEYRYDEEGNLLVKSEMMGDDEFFDHQVNLRRIGMKYEQIARRGIYEERFIMKHIGTGYEKKRYECDQCGIISANQHKYASHVRHAHPKSQKEREEAAKIRAERAAELKEEKLRKEALLPRSMPIEREKRERRPLARRPSGGSLLPPTFTNPAAPSDKIYVCPICDEEVASQHVFASHMRYNHPKDGTTTSMAGRRATVKRVIVKKEEPEDYIPGVIDTPESALHALSSVLSGTVRPTQPMIKRTKVLADGTGAYKCRVCGRAFDNLNACAGHTRHCIAAHGAAPSPPKPMQQQRVAPVQLPAGDEESLVDEDEVVTEDEGDEPMEMETQDGFYRCRVCGKTFNNPNSVAGHTRHCLAAHGGEPSPRALARRKAKGLSLPTHIIKTEPLPTSPLALVPHTSIPATTNDTGVEVLRHLRPKKVETPSSAAPAAAATPTVPIKTIKTEPVDEAIAKPAGRTTRNSAAAAMDQQQSHPVDDYELPPATAASVIDSGAAVSGRRPTRSSMAPPGVSPVATPTPSAATNGTTAAPSTSRPVVATRSSRSSARLISPARSDAASPIQPSTSNPTMPPPAKRARTSTNQFDHEIKREVVEEEETPRGGRSSERGSETKQETGDEDLLNSTPRRRATKADKKAAKAASRGLETEAARTCYYCHLQCTTIHAGDRHIRMKHPGREQIYSCSECSSTFLTLGGLENHWTKSEYCPQGFVMVGGRSIFDLDEEVKRRPLEVKQKGLDMTEDVAVAEEKKEEEVKPVEKLVDKKEVKRVSGEVKVETPKMPEKKEERRSDKREEKKVETPVLEKREEKKAERSAEKVVERKVEKKVEKPAEKKEEKRKEERVVEKSAAKKEEKIVDRPIDKTPKTEKSESSRPGPSPVPAIISLAATRSGANRQRKPANRFEP